MPDTTRPTTIHAPPATLVEPRMDEVFLTPRVVDQRAFDELASVLRSLVQDAAAQSRMLLNTSGEVRQLGDQLRDATRDLQGKVETAVRVVPTLDQRVAKAEQLLDRTNQELASREKSLREIVSRESAIDEKAIRELVRQHLSATVERALEGATHAIASSAQRAVEQASRQIDDSIARAREATTRFEATLESFSQRRDELVPDVATYAQRAREEASRAGEGILADAQARAGEILAKASARARELEHDLIARLSASAVQAQQQFARSIELLPQRVQESEDRAGLIVTELEKRIARGRKHADEAIAALSRLDGARLDELSRLAEQSDRLAGERESASAHLDELWARAQELSRRAEGSTKQLDQVRVQADQARQELSRALLASTDGIDRVEQRVEALARGQETLRAALADASTHAQRVALSLEEKVRQAHAELERSAQPILTHQARQIKQMGDWLAQLSQQATDAGRSLERLLREARGLDR